MPILTVESDISEFREKFSEIKDKAEDRSFSENMDVLNDLMDRVKNRRNSLRGDFLKTMDGSIRERKKMFRELESKVRKFKLFLAKEKVRN